MYQYDNGDSRNLLQDSGFRAGIGSFSDICDLEHLKVKGFNFGTGYHNERTKNCYCNRVEVAQQIALFRDFYNANYNTKMSHETRPIVYHKDYDYPKSAYGMTHKDWGLMYCEICGKDSSDIDDYSSISKHGVCWSCLKNYSYSDTYDYSDWRM